MTIRGIEVLDYTRLINLGDPESALLGVGQYTGSQNDWKRGAFAIVACKRPRQNNLLALTNTETGGLPLHHQPGCWRTTGW